MYFLAIGLFLLLTHSDYANSQSFSEVTLEISGYSLTAEVADTRTLRAQGLMYRETLGKDKGMLFVFPRSDYYSMWMKNTYIPLSVAFIDKNGIILNIADMHPETLTPHESVGLAKYALEMNVGWFSEKKIVEGFKVLGLGK
ncbi:MAG: DUF192 domain-containing protein [Betaproteobacteria bacterium]|nr:DUF192 domain-containing protein [Betaproteobacteria bacterium]